LAEKIIIGGVPEHFNIPWYYGTQHGMFNSTGWDVSWQSYPGGTGAMLADLKAGHLDMATLLTEGAIAGILDGIDASIVKFYVDSPLIWGIHVKKGSGITINDLQGKKYAISRLKSGSHLMPYVNASQRNLQIKESDFVIVKDLNGARKALANGEADLFFWEKYITKPYVDNGEFEKIASCPTPWPSFVVVCQNKLLKNHFNDLHNLFDQLHRVIQKLVQSGDIIGMVANEFGLTHFDAVKWYAAVEWNMDLGVDTEKLGAVVNRLMELNLIPTIPLDIAVQKLVDQRSIFNFVE
jgi:ABC-type nitrate/sulfonate/bicarbonate transport system substrate-binding protein